MGAVLCGTVIFCCDGEDTVRNLDQREKLRWEMEQKKVHGWDRSKWDPIPTAQVKKHGWHHRSKWKVFASSSDASDELPTTKPPKSATKTASDTTKGGGGNGGGGGGDGGGD